MLLESQIKVNYNSNGTHSKSLLFKPRRQGHYYPQIGTQIGTTLVPANMVAL